MRTDIRVKLSIWFSYHRNKYSISRNYSRRATILAKNVGSKRATNLATARLPHTALYGTKTTV